MASSKQTDLLVGAFKIAWTDYYQFGRNDAVSPETARPALAQFLVDKTREGMADEAALAAAGLDFLFSLEAPLAELVDARVPSINGDQWNMRLGNVAARFVRVQHVRMPRMR
jgi:hypothetical protein